VILSTPQVEVSGDVEIFYDILDSTNRTYGLKCAYSVDSGASWHGASVRGGLSAVDSAHYRGGVIWKSIEDQPGVDLETVRFRVTPVLNGAEGFAGKTEDFHLDNDFGSVVLTPIEGVVGRDVAIDYRISNAENSPIDLARVSYLS
jgi:hypothetical protein